MNDKKLQDFENILDRLIRIVERITDKHDVALRDDIKELKNFFKNKIDRTNPQQ